MSAEEDAAHNRALGAYVAELRRERAWTQADLAERLGTRLGRKVDATLITRLERGRREARWHELVGLAAVFGLPVSLFLSAYTGG